MNFTFSRVRCDLKSVCLEIFRQFLQFVRVCAEVFRVRGYFVCVYLVLGDFIHFTKRAVRSKQPCQEEQEEEEEVGEEVVGERNPKRSPAIR